MSVVRAQEAQRNTIEEQGVVRGDFSGVIRVCRVIGVKGNIQEHKEGGNKSKVDRR